MNLANRYRPKERRARLSYRELEQGLHLVAVVEHGTVDNTLMVFRKVLQVLIVGGNDAKRLLLPELLQHGLGNGSADGGFSTASELVDEQQSVAVGLLHHILHIQQVARIGTQVVGYRLLVANVNHDALKHAHRTPITNGNG